MTRALLALFLLAPLLGCDVQRSIQAAQARDAMRGLGREDLLACMGPPARRATEGATEVWSWRSGDGARSTGLAGGRVSGTNRGGLSTSTSFGGATARSRSCQVTAVLREGVVTAVNYAGPTGGPLTPDEQCAYATRNCLGGR